MRERERLCERVLAAGYAPMARQLAKRGVPSQWRPEVWSKALGADVSGTPGATLEEIYAGLSAEVDATALLADQLMALDLRATTDDGCYFVFEDLARNVSYALLRDPWVATHAAAVPLLPGPTAGEGSLPVPGAVNGDGGGTGNGDGDGDGGESLPPCGFLPYPGLSILIGPLCFVYGDETRLYFAFRAMYARFGSRMHHLSSRGDGVLRLSKTFETLLLSAHPQLAHHLMEVGRRPQRGWQGGMGGGKPFFLKMAPGASLFVFSYWLPFLVWVLIDAVHKGGGSGLDASPYLRFDSPSRYPFHISLAWRRCRWHCGGCSRSLPATWR